MEHVLPQPPTTNQLYSGRRYKTERYKAWIETAGWELRIQRIQPIKGNFALTIWTPSKADTDNVKALPDLLQTMGIVENDRLMMEIHVYRDRGPFRFALEQR